MEIMVRGMLCTDGAPTMLGLRSGLIVRIKNKNPLVVCTHHTLSETLGSRTVPPQPKNVLKSAIEVPVVTSNKQKPFTVVFLVYFAKICNLNRQILRFHTIAVGYRRGIFLKGFMNYHKKSRCF